MLGLTSADPTTPQHCHVTFWASLHLSMGASPLATRIRLLQAAAAREETALARQRIAIEALRSEGHRTPEAEKSYEKFESLHQGLLRSWPLFSRKRR